ncbi:Amidase [Metarhizium album ARSEF 1941]|uniref:Amidase n=1 Tax=Metarhizium album (strain ARSEF 1941) TaxID=1081103 RepID=A0A0B2WLN2_METAS|nr:Amidase [Metarhizium album ARSEF 1941]KHN94833.1 Amidase [Metarhizium album ARSEF 1941]
MARKQTLLLLALAATAACALVGGGVSLQLNAINYFVSPFPQGKVVNGTLDVKTLPNQLGFIPATVISDTDLSPESLSRNWSTVDDVWQPAFLENIFVVSNLNTESASGSWSYHDGVSSLVLSPDVVDKIPSGPYFVNVFTGQAHQAFRLYDDFAGSFTQSLLQRPDGRFQTLSAQVPAADSLTIGVPSRLYFTKTPAKPLAGVRVGVKDIYSLAGVKKGCGNRAWYHLYPAAGTTGTAMQNLIDKGAVIVGVQKTSQFANGETPTADWVDYHSPFNPRGDGYQDPATSSAGAGSSMASYEWLDLAVGSDTGGSIRGPAIFQGVFGNRPSHGLVSLDEVMPLSPRLDTAGFLARDPFLWNAANAALYGDNYTDFAGERPKYPAQLRLLDVPADNSSRSLVIQGFVSELAEYLGTTPTVLDLDKEWETTGPPSAGGEGLSQLLNTTYAAMIAKDQTRLVREPFYRDYAAAHDGRLPFVNPVPLARWGWGDSQPDSILPDAVRNKTLFMDWFNDKILPRSPEARTCSSGLLLVGGAVRFVSRNAYINPPVPPFGFSNGHISIFAETPDSVFPLGQVPEFSSITNHTEFLPVAIDVLAARGCDGLIARLAADLVAAGILEVPKVGAGLDGGEILMRRRSAGRVLQ